VRQPLPVTFITGLAPARPVFARVGDLWKVQAGDRECSFVLEGGRFKNIQTTNVAPEGVGFTR
jgi:hypothetical protein